MEQRFLRRTDGIGHIVTLSFAPGPEEKTSQSNSFIVFNSPQNTVVLVERQKFREKYDAIWVLWFRSYHNCPNGFASRVHPFRKKESVRRQIAFVPETLEAIAQVP